MKKLFCLFTAVFALGFFSCKNYTSEPNTPSPETPTTKVTYPQFSPIGGFYKKEQTVTISCEGSTAIYYTILKPAIGTDGKWDETAWQKAVKNSKPTENSTKYTEPFKVSEQCIIRTMAVKSDGSKNYAMTCFDFDTDRSTDFSGPMSPVNPSSENWQDQSIYFILTDRFFNGG